MPGSGLRRAACALLLVLCLPARGLAGDAPAPVPAGPAATRPLQAGFETDYPPFSFRGPDGRPAGISVEYLDAIAARLGTSVEVAAAGDLAPLLDRARRGEVDVLTSLARTPEREAFLAFTRPYFRAPAVLVAAAGKGAPAGIETMDGRKVAVGAGYGVSEFLAREYPRVQLVPVANDAAAIRLLLSGGADGAVLDLASLSWILSSTGVQGLRIVDDVGYWYELAMAVPAGTPELARRLDAALAALPEGEVRRIHDRWIRVELPSHHDGVHLPTWAGVALLVVLALAGATFAAGWLLRREVGRRTSELAASEQRYRLLADNARDVIWTLDLASGRFTYVSPSILALRGLTPEEAMAETVEQSMTPESFRRVAGLMVAIGKPGAPESLTDVYDQPCRDGTVKHVEITTTLIRQDGLPVQVLGVSRDATERVRSAAALDRTRRTLVMLTRCSETILRATTEEELFRGVCRVIVDVGGYRMCWAGIAANDERRTVRPLAAAGEGTDYLDAIEISWADVPAGRGPTGTAIRDGVVVTGAFESGDPTLSPWRQAALRHGFRSSVALPVSFGGETVGSITMYSTESVPVGGDDLRILRQLADDVAFGVSALRQRATLVRTDSERTEALRALSSEQDRFRALIEGSSDLTLVLDAGGEIRFASPASREVLGQAPEALLGQALLDHVHPDDQPVLQRALAGVAVSSGAGARVELHIRRADGAHALVEAGLRNLLGVAGVDGVVVNGRDITERNRLREQFQQAQKLESVGRLAGGVAHDFNNLLTIILSCGEELRSAVAGNPRSLESAEDVLAAARRASDLTRQLLAFARKQVITPEIVDLNALLGQGKKLIGRVIGEDVRVVETYQDGLWPVRCDPGLFSQVVMNLAVNARDAMPGGGTMTLSTANVDLREGDLRPDPEMVPGPWVRFSIGDTGTGMAPEVLAHVFEPFYTTKAPGVGTGLGLATVYGIVKQSGAHLTVRSVPGQGTTFDVYFPRAAEEVQYAAAREAAPPQGSETVLVVEDDAKVREVVVRALRGGGYRVLAADGAEQAYDLARRERALRLVVTDVVMPGAGGREVARRLAELRPGLRVLYVSGYTHDAISRQGVLDEGIEFLPKPFTTPTLLARVRTLLDRA